MWQARGSGASWNVRKQARTVVDDHQLHVAQLSCARAVLEHENLSHHSKPHYSWMHLLGSNPDYVHLNNSSFPFVFIFFLGCNWSHDGQVFFCCVTSVRLGYCRRLLSFCYHTFNRTWYGPKLAGRLTPTKSVCSFLLAMLLMIVNCMHEMLLINPPHPHC